MTFPIRVLSWLPHGRPVPAGCAVPPQRLDSHHQAYGVLVEYLAWPADDDKKDAQNGSPHTTATPG